MYPAINCGLVYSYGGAEIAEQAARTLGEIVNVGDLLLFDWYRQSAPSIINDAASTQPTAEAAEQVWVVHKAGVGLSHGPVISRENQLGRQPAAHLLYTLVT